MEITILIMMLAKNKKYDNINDNKIIFIITKNNFNRKK